MQYYLDLIYQIYNQTSSFRLICHVTPLNTSNTFGMYSKQELRSFNLSRPCSLKYKQTLKDLGIFRHKPTRRGCRGGKRRHIQVHVSNRNVAIPFNINKSTPTVNSANLICVNNKKKKGNYTPLHVATLNARSVRNKAHFLSDYILEHDIDILVITETWLYNKGDEATLNQLIPTGYGYEFNNRQQRGGGGVMVIFKHSLNITKSKVEISKSLEIIEILCKTTKSVYRLMGVYRPPPSKKKNCL